MDTTRVGSHVHWARSLHDHPHAQTLRSVLARAVTAAHRPAALEHPAVTRRLADIPLTRRQFLLTALGTIAAHPHLRHDGSRSLGMALGRVSGAHSAYSLATSTGGDTAGRILGPLVVRAGRLGPVNLVAYAELLTHWDELPLHQRVRPLIDMHNAHHRA